MKVVLYADACEYKDHDDSTRYIHEMMQKDDAFEPIYSPEADPTLADDAHVIFCRFEIPPRRAFLEELHRRHEGKQTLFVNPPAAKLVYTTKAHLVDLLDTGVLPKTCISSDYRELADFARGVDKCLMKPMDMNGGKGIERFTADGTICGELEGIAATHTQRGKVPVVYQEFLPEVTTVGDKRLNVAFYEPVSAVMRYAKEGSYLCNLSQGGTKTAGEVTERDREVVAAIRPWLEEHGIVWCGVDMIGDWLSEVNISSPGLFQAADVYNGNTNGYDAIAAGIKRWYVEHY